MAHTPGRYPVPLRRFELLEFVAALMCVACGSPGGDAAVDSAPRADVNAAASGVREWIGQYALTGTIDQNRQATGTLAVERLEASAPLFDATQQRVRRAYPDYEGPFYSARLEIVAGSDTTRGDLTCAHGPADQPPLVCEPITPLTGFEGASLVVRPDSRAVLTGSHGEGVSTEYARFTWTARSGG